MVSTMSQRDELSTEVIDPDMYKFPAYTILQMDNKDKALLKILLGEYSQHVIYSFSNCVNQIHCKYIAP